MPVNKENPNNHKPRKVALVTGGSSGMGAATAARLADAGFTTYAAARRLEKMEPLKTKDIKVIALDVTDEASIQSCVNKITAESGGVDVLVNAAGYGSYGAIEDVPLTEGKNQFQVNLFGAVRLIQLVLPHMRENHYGKIVNITSIGGKIYTPMGGWYHATKFAFEGLSDSLRLEVQGFGIDVIVIEPGGVNTEWGKIALEHLLENSQNSAYASWARKIASLPQGRGSDPDVIAKVIEKAVLAKKPKTRYAKGSTARLMLTLRKILPDRQFDGFLRFFLNRAGK